MANKVVNVKEISKDEWLNLRRTGIGGSDAAAVIGFNSYSSKYTLYYDKLGMIPNIEDNEAMRQGRDFEDYVAKRFSEATGKKVQRNNFMWRHENGFMLADIDREIVGENAGLECKTTSLYNKSDFENGEIPQYYYAQCVHYMAVRGYDRMYLAVLVLSEGFYFFTIERDESEIEALIESERVFWFDNVLARVEPLPDGSESTADTIKLLYPGSKTTEGTQMLHSYNQELHQYILIGEQIEQMQKRYDEIKNIITATMAEKEFGQSEDFKVSYKGQSKTTVDSSTLKNEHPDIFERYKKVSEYRVLRITKTN